jgi:hypothetical protein
MAKRNDVIIRGKKAKRGERLRGGRGYQIVTKGNRIFPGTLIKSVNAGKYRIAIFSVPK